MPLTFISQPVIRPQAPARLYTGPGDVVPGAVLWYGLRAYSDATTGTNSVRLRRDSDNAEQDFVTLSTGELDEVSVASFKGAANLFVVTFYDKAGTNDATQSTAASQLEIRSSVLGSFSVVNGAGLEHMNSISNVTQAQPFTVSIVARRISNAGAFGFVTGAGVSEIGLGFYIIDGSATMYANGGLPAVGITEGTWYAMQGCYNGASSDLNMNGTVNTVDPGSAGYSSETFQLSGNKLTSSTLNQGQFTEAGMWGSLFSTTQRSNMATNQQTFWGF